MHGIAHIGSILKRARRAQRATAGFTLVEMLAALIVLMLLTGIVTVGIQTASNFYRQSTFESQSEILSGTINNALSDPFRFMKVETTTNAATGSTTTAYKVIYQDDENQQIQSTSFPLVAVDGQLYFKGTDGSGNALSVKVLNSGTYGDCAVSIDQVNMKIDISTGKVTIVYTITNKNDTTLHHDYTVYYKLTDATKA